MNQWILMQRKTHCYPAPMIYAIGKVYSHTMREIMKGVSFEVTLALIEDGTMLWHAREDTVKNVSDKALEILKSNPNYLQEIREKFMKISPQLLEFTEKEIFDKDLKKCSNEKLWQLYNQYLELYDQIYTWSEPIAFSLKENFEEFLRLHLIKKTGDKKKANDYLNILSSPTEISFVKKEEQELWNIALEAEREGIESKEIKRLITKHTSQFCWVPYDYGVSLWTEDYFIQAIKAILEEGNIKEKLEKNKRYFQELPQKQKDIVKELKLDNYYQDLFKAVRSASFLMDYKKEIFTKSHYHIKFLLEEIGRRFEIKREFVQLYLPEELKAALLENKRLTKEQLDERNHFSLIYWEGNKTYIYSGKEAKKKLKEFSIKGQDKSRSVLDGMIASAGRVKGKVKVVMNAKDIDKVMKGDILVAPMTSPDYVPAMRKAAAIVTDEGGITCHAAIVSRELGIPCVIGTKVATKVFKDGDMIEVNANHNSVRIIKQ